MAALTLQRAEEWVAKARSKAEHLGVKVSICVVDSSGTPVTFCRLDGAGMMTPEVARAKAYTAIAFKRNTKDTAENFKDRPAAAAGLMEVAGGKIIFLAGGVIAMKEGEVQGAVGVSGATSDQDHECAAAAVS